MLELDIYELCCSQKRLVLGASTVPLLEVMRLTKCRACNRANAIVAERKYGLCMVGEF